MYCSSRDNYLFILFVYFIYDSRTTRDRNELLGVLVVIQGENKTHMRHYTAIHASVYSCLTPIFPEAEADKMANVLGYLVWL